MRLLHLLVLTFFLSLQAISQGYSPYIRNFGPRDFSKSQPPENYAILQDQLGYLYFASAGGVLQYDGKNWQFIPVKTGYFVSTLTQSSDGTIFVGTFADFGYLEKTDKGLLTYHSLLNLVPESNQNNSQVIRSFAAEQLIYFQFNNQIIAYNHQTKTCSVVLENRDIHLSFLLKNRLFCRERNVGLIELTGTNSVVISSDTLFKDYGIFSILEYQEEQLLIVTQEKGLFIFDEKSKELYPFGQNQDVLLSIRFYGGIKQSNGNFALYSLDHGILIINPNGDIDKVINKKGGLSTDEVTQLYSDRQQNLWAVSPNGITFINIESPFEYFRSKNGLEGSSECVGFLNNYIYAGTSEGLFEMQSSQNYFTKRKEINGHVYSIQYKNKQTKNELILSTSTGIYQLKNNEIRLLHPGNFQLSIELNSHFQLLVGINQLLIARKSDDQIIQKWSQQITRALSVVVDSNRHEVWIGTVAMGVLRIYLNNDHSKIESIDIYDDLDGLDIEFTRPVLINGEIKLISSGGFNSFVYEEEVKENLPDSLQGKAEFERGYFDIAPFKSYKNNQEVSAFLEVDSIFSIFCTKNKLIAYVDDQKIEAEFNSIDIGRINGLFAHQNSIYICGDEGIIRVNTNHILHLNHNKVKKHPFSALIKSVKNKSGEYLFGGQLNEAFIFPTLSYVENSLEFEFAFPYFESHHLPEFSWLLEGMDDQWTEWNSESKIRFTNLHEGGYTLKVKAKTIDGIESQAASFQFTILAPWYRTTLAYVTYVFVFLILVWIAIKISSYNLKKKNIKLENIVQERTFEIASKNKELELSNEQILHQKNEITDSITYAKRIQEAILPLNTEIKKHIPNSFILFKPKDIVSGDFYWFHHTTENDLLICADCTGHGVPGAFMSMICTDKLNHAVLEKKIKSPGSLLSEVNIGIKRSLKQENSEGSQTKDGMDAAVIAINSEKKQIIYSGANRALWLIRSGEIIEYRPTKTAVGGFTPENQIFEEQIISIQSGDRFYMSTDGYADQFGGDKGKKMMIKNFKELLLKIQIKSIHEQEELLNQHFEDWKNHLDEYGSNFEQVDDVCVIGIEF